MKNEKKYLVREFNNKLKKVNWKNTICICGSVKSIKVYKKDRNGIINPVVMCLKCGTFRADPIPPESTINAFYSSDLYQKIYSNKDLESHFKEMIYLRKKNNIFTTVEKFLAKGKDSKIIEIGCGGGWNLEPFQRFGYKNIIGYEPGNESRKIGIRELKLDIKEGFIKDVIETGDKYDLIILNHVIEHLLDPFEVIQSLKKILSDNGILYLGLPNMQNLAHTQIQNAHYWYFSPLFFMKLVNCSGLQICDFGNDKNHFYCISTKSKIVNSDKKIYNITKLISHERNILLLKIIPSLVIDKLKIFLRPLKNLYKK